MGSLSRVLPIYGWLNVAALPAQLQIIEIVDKRTALNEVYCAYTCMYELHS